MPGRPIFAVLLATLAFAGCGGDDDPEADRPAGGTETEVRTATSPRTDATTPEAARRPDAETETGASDSDSKERGGAADSGSADDRKNEKNEKNEKKGKSDAKRQSSGNRTSTGTPTAPRKALTGRALRRCLLRTARLRGQPRVRGQARCLGMTARRLRRLIVTNCRRATKTKADERNCIKIGTG